AQRAQAAPELPRLAEPRAPAVSPDHLRLDPVQLEELERLRVLARRHLDLVAAPPQELDQRPEHEHVRRRGHVDPDPQKRSTTRNRIASISVSSGIGRSKKRSCAT